MRDSVYGFLITAVFWQYKEILSPHENEEPEDARYIDHHNQLYYWGSLWTDVYGVIITVGISLDGSKNDWGLYNDWDRYRVLQKYFNGVESAIRDTGLQGNGRHIIFFFKGNQWQNFYQCREMNWDIRKERIRNVRPIVHLSHLCSLFSWHWCMKNSLISKMYRCIDLLVIKRIRKSDIHLVSIE